MPVGVTFTVHGEAATAGSKRAFVRGGRAFVVDDARAKGKPWRAAIQAAAAAEMRGGALLTGPLCLIVRFERPRPAGHFGRSGLNAPGRRSPYPTSRPDLLKHVRALEDALTGVVWRDDAQIVEQHLEKRWGPVAKTTVAVWVKEPE